ncbi:bifunctional diguanylate cyclase/phosphodiesterase [Pseudokineococcus basanitobsidens]|uniref:Bifunctional diguanylate cyclase/phosphodiesterase n=1 Tax=Pseudokineococcus basanitobsidens TaxID=1926649 RepID=A0ABU8RKN9_9ACTN
MEGWGRVPEVATPRMTAAVFGVFFILGAASALSVVVGLEPSPARRQIVVLAVLALLTGAACVGLRNRIGRAVLHAVVSAGTGLIATGVVVVPEPSAALVFAVLLVFIAVDSAVFFAVPAGLVHLAVCVGAGTAALLARGDVAPTQAVALDVALVAVAAVVRILAVRASSASVDPLTGLPNRRGLDQALERAGLAAEREGDGLVVALLDLDGFGAVNDALGHEAGDALLVESARAWRGALPRDVVLARVGGDEFAVLLPGRTAPEAVALLDPLCTDAHRPASGGVAERGRTESASDVIRRADTALYRAKSSGHGRCAVADAELPGRGGSAALARDLAAALREGALDVVYQPVLRAVDGAAPADLDLVGAEALARWHHPEHGPVSPAVFVALAEREGLVGELGAVVLERACRDLRDVPGAVERGLLLTVNVSGLELLDPRYPQHVGEVLARTGWPARLLVLEVTESVVEADSRPALAALRAVAALGVHLAVDDFGTGYSALSRLDDLEARYLKLDSTLTATVHTSPRRARLVRAAAALAQSLDMVVIAEGVEGPEQAQVLGELGCPLLQGYHLGRPGPVEALAGRLRTADDRGRAGSPAVVPLPRRGATTDAGAGAV